MSAGLAALVTILLEAAPAAAHHVGAYTPRDNEISANFKQLKFSIQARKLDVALKLFETGALRQAMRAQASKLPPGLEESTRAALRAGDGPGAERGLVTFFAALARDLALEGDRQLADPRATLEARAAAARKFLEAIWRYYNLIDFAVTQREPKAAATIRLAVDEAEAFVKPAAAPAAPNPDRVRGPLREIARVLGDVIAAAPMSTRRES